MRYLVAYVADDSGADALALASMLARSQSADLTVCIAIPQTAGLPLDASQSGFEQLVQSRAEEWLEQAREKLDADLTADFITASGDSTAGGLLGVVADAGAAMIVLGSARTNALGRFVAGSVAGQLLRSSPVPLAFAPQGFAGTAPRQLRRVMVGIDDLRYSTAALESAAQLCRRDDLPLALVTFFFPDSSLLRGLPGMGGKPDDQERIERTRLLELAAAGVQDIKATVMVVDGSDAESAMAEVGWQDGDLLVIGSSRRGAVAQVVLGSTAQKLLRSAPVPVLAVPRGADVDLEHTAPIPKVSEAADPQSTG
jgi:nucleotide-binding universal stress UspA family protein